MELPSHRSDVLARELSWLVTHGKASEQPRKGASHGLEAQGPGKYVVLLRQTSTVTVDEWPLSGASASCSDVARVHMTPQLCSISLLSEATI